ncbi:MAG TPA: alpha/beta hydrolase fold domain-containing protein [Angustibacter sp.]|nr:alpha/beta hydrolase fold domain-containing protein [Angustibacter sp.]
MTRGRRRGRTAVRAAVALVLGLVAVGCGAAQPAAAPTHSRTGAPPLAVEYGAGLTEDVYLPSARRTAPLVLMVPGGSWASADPTGLADLAGYLADAGAVAVPTRIRAAEDGVRYPVPVDDVLCALASAAATARSHGLLPGPLVVLGHSSGAHLAALAVLAADDYSPACRAPVVTPDALIGLAGPYDVSQVPDLALALFGNPPERDPTGWAAGNPVRRAALRPAVPVLLVHGEDDAVVPTSFTADFAARLKAGGHPVSVDYVPGADHGSVFSSAVAGPIISRWLTRPG